MENIISKENKNKNGTVEIVNGDLLLADVDIICHQVNLQGVMGGGLAYSIAQKFPHVEKTYAGFKDKALGNVCFVETDMFVVSNCFSQDYFYRTNYSALSESLEKVRNYMKEHHFKTIGIPYKYGCGIAIGDWDKVFEIFKTIFEDFDLRVYKIS